MGHRARGNDQHILGHSTGQRLTEPEVMERILLRLDRERDDRNIRLRPDQCQRHPDTVIQPLIPGDQYLDTLSRHGIGD